MVELVLAVTIIALVFASTMTLMGRGFGVLDDSRLNTLAAQVLQSEVETLRLLNWAEVTTLPAKESFSAESEFTSAGFERFTCTRVVEAAGTYMRKITVTAAWTSPNGPLRERTYITYIGKEGLSDYYQRQF